MLRELHIENIAVIERCSISFNPGLNVLTGETGAGKSIIIDALNAVLGNRTSRELVRRGAENAVVSAVFEPVNEHQWLADNDIEESSELILQRKITSDGKSSCRVNGIPVTASQLKDLASRLVDIHGQNDGLRLLNESSHLGFLDRFSEDEAILNAYKTEYEKYNGIKKEIRSLSMDDEDKAQLGDTLRFRIDELSRAELKKGEHDALSARRDLLRNSEKLCEALDSALSLLAGEEDSALSMTQNAVYYAERAARFAPELENSVKSLSDAAFSISDVSEIFRDFRESLDFSPEEYDKLESRISQLDRLERKYSRDECALIDYLEECREKLDSIEYSGERLEKLNRELAAQAAICSKTAEKLSAVRKSSAVELQKRIEAELAALNMPSVKFIAEVSPTQLKEGFGPDGADEVCFLISANAGELPGKISRIASGGELSRIMLALKNVFAEHDTIDTMIFDEIDTGVSGISAQRVAEKLYCVSKNRQVMCVSHLPQIAAMGDSQYLVFKSEHDGRTYTEVSCLDPEGRKNEIARLYGGDNITATTLAAAEEQLEAAKIFKN
ncbi:MAG: DNA repair protein RecN [Eubacteriales bacterium]|nr:DNA repair protein RecN [Eubacteriales bacterium]